jgi:hypothetical protein
MKDEKCGKNSFRNRCRLLAENDAGKLELQHATLMTPPSDEIQKINTRFALQPISQPTGSRNCNGANGRHVSVLDYRNIKLVFKPGQNKAKQKKLARPHYAPISSRTC